MRSQLICTMYQHRYEACMASRQNLVQSSQKILPIPLYAICRQGHSQTIKLRDIAQQLCVLHFSEPPSLLTAFS